MRNSLHTPFWRAAYQSLPETVRQRYLAHIERAERWELALDVREVALPHGLRQRLVGRPPERGTQAVTHG